MKHIDKVFYKCEQVQRPKNLLNLWTVLNSFLLRTLEFLSNTEALELFAFDMDPSFQSANSFLYGWLR